MVPTQGLSPLSRDALDVLGPITKTVADAALAYDVIAPGPTAYSSLLGQVTLEGKRVGLLGPSWRTNTTLSATIESLYASAVEELVALGATVVDDPFAGTNISAVSESYSGEGFAGAAYDFQNYLKGLGISSYHQFVNIVGEDPATPGGPLGFVLDAVPLRPDGTAETDQKPDLAPFFEFKAAYTDAFARAFNSNRLDVLVYPSTVELVKPAVEVASEDFITVPEVNVAGVPVVTVPSTRFDGPLGPQPFSLAFIGQADSEPTLLALAHDYEQATQLRIVPDLP